MKKIKLKEEFKGLIFQRRCMPIMGEVIFDTNKAPESAYENYAKIGFDDLFEWIDADQAPAEVVEEATEVICGKCGENVVLCGCESAIEKAEKEVKRYSKEKKKKD